jgi:hypothetical protein
MQLHSSLNDGEFREESFANIVADKWLYASLLRFFRIFLSHSILLDAL